MMLRRMIVYLLVGLIAIVAISLVAGYAVSAPRYRGNKSDHFNGSTFFNPQGIEAHGFRATVRWMLNREKGNWGKYQDFPPGEKPPAQVKDGMRITFVNHATFLIQVNGLNILSDPIWSDRTSPLSFAGPRRMRPPGIRFEDLPKIHYVIVSHNHYDHLDLPTLKKLAEGHQPEILTPLGVNAFLREQGIDPGRDLDWWEQFALNQDVTVSAVPAQHFSGRGMFDRNATLWAGYVLKTKAGNVYFAGDTGYDGKTFERIGREFAPIRVALLPIGAYKPIWFMGPIHISPEEAIKTHQSLNAQTSIAMHFGTFPLADDGREEPLLALDKARQKHRISQEEFVVIKEGSAWSSGAMNHAPTDRR